MSTGYEKHRETMRKRAAEQSYGGRDIAPLPKVRSGRRKGACKKNFRKFCETYFEGTFHLGWSDDHLHIIERIETAVLKGGLFSLAMPRGSGKTSLCETAAIWAILYGHRKSVVLIGASEDAGAMMLDSVKAEIEMNELLAADFPEVCYPIEKLDGIVNRTSTEFQHFTQAMTSLSLKALDIPYSFYDEGYTNFFGSRSAFIHYEKACKAKQAQLSELLDHITGWRMKLFIADGTLKLPSGLTLGQLNWEWVADGTPWWNPLQEINADIAAINNGLKTRSMVVRERHGKEFRDVVDQLSDEQKYMAEAGIIVDIAGVPLDADQAGEEIQRQAIEIVDREEEL